LLIEAGLIGLKVIGYDIDQIMINRAKINLEYFGIDKKSYELKKKDALSISDSSMKNSSRIKCIVADLPYGKNTKLSEFKHVYFEFLDSLSKVIFKRAVLGFPVFRKDGKEICADYNKMILDRGLKIAYSFDQYLHKSLSKRIFVIERR